jgi:NADPH:quinone reductase-like Zn-dependent oxidoreductase
LITSCKIRGYDGAGVVVKAGSDALFEVGDEVFYSGMSHRDGTNAQYQVVDSRVVGPKPKSLDWAEATSYPLVGLTVWEIFERHFGMKAGVIPEEENTIVIVNGAGGVGSIATQLSKACHLQTHREDLFCTNHLIMLGLWYQEHYCHCLASRDYRVGETTWCDSCHQPS